MKVGSLFAGIGGFDLAASWMGWTTAWYSEIDPYASAVMAKHFPSARNHGDITKIDGRNVEHVDLLCGGFPCQDISLAGKGAGLAGERSGLWSHYARLIEEIRPSWVVIENVSALRSRGLDVVLGEIAALGYDAEWHCIPASAVGAPHRRDRVWIVAHAHSNDGGPGRPGRLASGSPGQLVTERPLQDATPDSVSELVRLEPGWSGGSRWPGTSLFAVDGKARAVADSNGERGPRGQPWNEDAEDVGESPRRANAGWWLTEPDVGRVANGVPSRVDRLKCLGNAIVPQVAYEIFQAIERSR